MNEGQAAIWVTPGLVDTAGLSPSYSVAAVDLGPGVDIAAFDDYVRSRVDPAAGVQVQPVAVRALVIERTMSPYVQALTLFALIGAATSLAVLGPALARWAATHQDDRLALLAAGVRPAQLRLAAALRGAAVGVAGAGIAVAIAVLVSPRFPVGPVRRAEPLGGIRVDVPVLAIGVVGLVAVAALLGALAPIGVRPRRERTSVLAERVAALGVGAPVVVGVRAALARGRSGAGPVATAAGVTVALAAVVAALAYQGGLVRMLDSPERFGWTWDAAYESYEGELDDGRPRVPRRGRARRRRQHRPPCSDHRQRRGGAGLRVRGSHRAPFDPRSSRAGCRAERQRSRSARRPSTASVSDSAIRSWYAAVRAVDDHGDGGRRHARADPQRRGRSHRR